MDSELKKYLPEQCRSWMLEEEIIALRRFTLTEYGKSVTQKNSLISYQMEKHYGFNNEKVNELVAMGQHLAKERIAHRILEDNPNILNNCAKCGKLARTPKARQCRYCGNKWFDTDLK